MVTLSDTYQRIDNYCYDKECFEIILKFVAFIFEIFTKPKSDTSIYSSSTGNYCNEEYWNIGSNIKSGSK